MPDDDQPVGLEIPGAFKRRVGTIEGAPEKTALLSLSTLDPDRAILELTDNAIDAARVNDREQTTIDVILGEDLKYLEIRDRSGGIPEESLDVWLTLGASRQASAEGYSLPDSIGWAGVGAIEASLSIGDSVMLASRAENADQGFAYYIDESYLVSEDWSLDYYEYDGLDPGETVIRIEDLKIDLADLHGDYASLEDLLSTTYELYLMDTTTIEWADNTPKLDVDITIFDQRVGEDQIEKIPVQANVVIDWAFMNFDKSYPRLYHSFTLVNEDTEGDVRLDIVCGLTRTKFDNPGVHLYANGRKIFNGNTSYEAGFGFRNGLNQFRSERHGRLVFLVLIRSLDSPRDIPTENNKTTLRDGNETTNQIKKRLGRAGLMYMHLSDVHRVPTPITAAYPAEHKFAAHGGQIEVLDYSDNQDIKDHPGGKRNGRYYELDELDEFKQTVKQHAKLCISCPDLLEPRHRPAYTGLKLEDLDSEEAKEQYEETEGFLQNRFNANYNSDDRYHETPVRIEKEELPPQDIDIDSRLKTLERLARRNSRVDSPFRYTELAKWEEPYYLEKMYQFTGVDPMDLPTRSSLPPLDAYLYEHGILPSEEEESEGGELVEFQSDESPETGSGQTTLADFVAAYESKLAELDIEGNSEYEKLGHIVEGYVSIISNERLDDIPIEADTREEKIKEIVNRYAEFVGLATHE